MNLVINYCDSIKKTNTSNCISGVEAEGDKLSNTGTKHLSYREVVRTGSGQEKAISTHPPQECVVLVPYQDRPFFYTRSHLSALQNCALLFSTNFQFIFIFKNA